MITSAIRVPDGVEGNGARGRGFYVEDGGNPAFLSWTLEATSTPALAWRTASFFLRRLWAHQRGDPQSNYSSQLASLINPGDLASTFLPLLAMGRDVPDGVMSLRDGDLEINWSTRTSKNTSRVSRRRLVASPRHSAGGTSTPRSGSSST